MSAAGATEGPDRWWADRALLPQLALPAVQLARIEEIYRAGRLRLIEREVAVERAAVLLEDELSRPELGLAVAEAAATELAASRAALETAHVAMLLDLRGELSANQWRALQELHRGPGPGDGQQRRQQGGPGLPVGRQPPARSPEGPGQPGGRQGTPGPPPPSGPGGPAHRQPTPPPTGPQPQQPGPQPAQVSGPQLTPGGAWWRDDSWVRRLGLRGHQVTALDEVFRASRLGLIDRRAALSRAEVELDPLVRAPTLDRAAAVPASERLAVARGELEAAHLVLQLRLLAQLDASQRRLLMPAGGGLVHRAQP